MHYAELRLAREELTGPGGQFEITEAEVLGNRLRVFKNAPPSVREVWLASADFAERPYLIYGEELLTYAQSHMQVNAVAAWLFAQGIKPGDRVAIAMRNYPEWMLIYWACVSVGVAAVGMNAWWNGEEMAFAIMDAAPKALFADPERLARLAESPGLADGVKLVGVRLTAPQIGVTDWAEVIGHGGALPEVSVDPDADACIFYTSGTTGFPKGAQLPPDLVLKIDQQIKTARPTTGYGMTETCGIITSVTGDFFVAKPDSAGPSMPNFEVKCVDDDGNTVPQGEIGELWVKGSSVIKGYINRPDATAGAITDGGWLHTGDVARIDEDGFIYIVDRKKDMVLRGGENVFCTEVEAGIYRHPAVAECCVFGVADERLGEEVGVAVVLKAGDVLDETDLRQHCLDVMAKHKVPRYVWFMTEALPRNASGKFLRRELRDELSKQLETT